MDDVQKKGPYPVERTTKSKTTFLRVSGCPTIFYQGN